ncbi:MAG: GYD domain-containing protein [Chloroflexi bacterium]|nr:GYD domain-containing protein [Chloroflexota bacterium]
MQYILLVRLSPEGIDATLENPRAPLDAERSVSMPDVSSLGIYAVLGPYDFVAIIDAPDNDAAARWSIAFSARVRGEITTMPAVPISHLEGPGDPDRSIEASEPLPGQTSQTGL